MPLSVLTVDGMEAVLRFFNEYAPCSGPTLVWRPNVSRIRDLFVRAGSVTRSKIDISYRIQFYVERLICRGVASAESPVGQSL